MRISGITSHLHVDNIKKLDQQKKAGSASANGIKNDKPEISSDGVRLSNTASDINTVKTQAELTPAIRTQKVEEVKGKIENGFYNSDKFIDQLAEKIMKDFGIS